MKPFLSQIVQYHLTNDKQYLVCFYLTLWIPLSFHISYSSDDSYCDAINTFAGTEVEVAEHESVINNLKCIAGDDLLEHHFLTKEEIAKRGYDSSHVKKAAIFPKDGNFPPYLDQELESIIKDKGGNVSMCFCDSIIEIQSFNCKINFRFWITCN